MFRLKNNRGTTEAKHHEHDHNEVDEAILLSETKSGRKKLLVAGVSNTALMATAAGVAYKSGADATWIETVHNIGDMGYYLFPWAFTMRSHLNSESALKWMRRTSATAAALAGTAMTSSVYEAVTQAAKHPGLISVPAQAGFAIGNAAIAVYVGREPGSSTIDRAAIRHAKNDARTSVVAGIGNALAVTFAPFNPISAVVVGAMTIKTESSTISEATQALKPEPNKAISENL